MDRRRFLKIAALAALLPGRSVDAKSSGILVNDIHSQLNPTIVSKVIDVRSVAELEQIVAHARQHHTPVSVCGQRHAGGGQQFATGSILIDTSNLKGIISFDRKRGLLEMFAGTTWPEILSYLESEQKADSNPWGISQKQTGSDLLSVGGALSANAHGQGLKLKPIVGDVESFTLVNSSGKTICCSRSENEPLFNLVIGGYGLFGIITTITLRLVPRLKLRRAVRMISIDQVPLAFEKCVAAGCSYGDYQFNIDDKSAGYLQNGIFTCYESVDPSTTSIDSKPMANEDWLALVLQAHVDKASAYAAFAGFYQKTAGLCNWADRWQSGPYVHDYHKIIDARLHSVHAATEILTELYVPRTALCHYIADVRADFLSHKVDLIYSTIRFIARDDESFLPWAKQDYVCVIFNLHTVHTTEGIANSAAALKRLIDYAIKYDGSYYLTYHKFATREQVLSCYPNFERFLQLKREYDPREIFQSDWYRHYKKVFS